MNSQVFLGRTGTKKSEDHGSSAGSILRHDELTNEIRDRLQTEDGNEISEVLIEDLVDKLIGPVSAELRSAVEQKFAVFAANSIQDEKKRHVQFKENFIQIYQLVQAYNEGAEIFEGLGMNVQKIFSLNQNLNEC